MDVDTKHYPAGGTELLVLAHGAGAGHQHPFMVAFGRALSARGIDVVTFNFAYMQQKRKAPDRAPVLEATFRGVIERVRANDSVRQARLFIGGKSMGGRMATHLAAQGVDGLAGVIALGYPLHPPGKPEQPRSAHLPDVAVPVLVVQGERDNFGTPAELRPVIATMRAPVTLHAVAGGDHSLSVSRKTDYDGLADLIARWIRELRS
jgi:uncharacterized protein